MYELSDAKLKLILNCRIGGVAASHVACFLLLQRSIVALPLLGFIEKDSRVSKKGRYEKEEWTLSDPTVFCERAVHSVKAASLTRQVTSCFPNDARRCTGSSGRCARRHDTAGMSLLATLPCSARCRLYQLQAVRACASCRRLSGKDTKKSKYIQEKCQISLDWYPFSVISRLIVR